MQRRQSQKCTGQFFVDEDLLREIGITDFSQYAVDPNAPLIEDLFIGDVPKEMSSMIPLTKEPYKISSN